MRLSVDAEVKAQKTVASFYQALGRRLTAVPEGNCPLSLSLAFIRLCLSQSCGKCVPCRVGLDALAEMLEHAIKGKAKKEDLAVMEKTAQAIYDSADCAIGFEAAGVLLEGLKAFRDDFVSHVEEHRCTASFKAVPCKEGCPAHVDIPGYIALVKEGRYADAVRLIRQDNPFPAVCGLICEHPCEMKCRRNLVDDAVNIRALKRFAVDNAGDVPAPASAPATGKKVAIVGAGPSGLTAAYYLSLMGHAVTIFERRPQAGGMLRYGIPTYRLPDADLDKEINTILSNGAVLKTGVDIGKDITIDALKADYDSVYISIGAHSDNKLGIDGEDAEGVLSAVKLLGDTGEHQAPDFSGKKVVVVGGGNVAMDATRTSKRLGAAEVTCVYRRRVQDMTALPDEIEGAAAEGCEIRTLLAPVRIESENGKVTAIILQPQQVGPIEKGRTSVKKANLPEVRIPADVIVVAIGQKVDSRHFEESGYPVKRGLIETGKDLAVLGKDGVFSGGDNVTGPATVIRAIRAGKIAAFNMDEYMGFHSELPNDVEVPAASWMYTPACGRANTVERPAAERKGDFAMMEIGLTKEEAEQECSRCLRCDHYGYGAFRGGRKISW